MHPGPYIRRSWIVLPDLNRIRMLIIFRRPPKINILILQHQILIVQRYSDGPMMNLALLGLHHELRDEEPEQKISFINLTFKLAANREKFDTVLQNTNGFKRQDECVY
jgi:hypothetical protein